MKPYKSMEELAKESLRIYNGMIVINPFYGSEEPVRVTDIILKFPTGRVFARNNSTVCYVWNDDVYAVPYTKRVISTLYQNRYYIDNFHVFFSNGDFPKAEQSKWFNIMLQARDERDFDFREETKEWCARHGIKEIAEVFLDKCIRIPDKGLEYKSINFEGRFTPVIDVDDLTETAIRRVGKYNVNNGAMCFVYVDGHTYIARRRKSIITELEAAGFKLCEELYVPMSNGERLKNPMYQRKWEYLENL